MDRIGNQPPEILVAKDLGPVTELDHHQPGVLVPIRPPVCLPVIRHHQRLDVRVVVHAAVRLVNNGKRGGSLQDGMLHVHALDQNSHLRRRFRNVWSRFRACRRKATVSA